MYQHFYLEHNIKYDSTLYDILIFRGDVMEIIVQKFGGTSVANQNNRDKVINKITQRHQEGYSIVVVVSAIGRKGDPYSTDSLLGLVERKAVSKRELDLLMSCGEIISSVVLSNSLSKLGYKNIVLNGQQAGINTDNYFGNAKVVNVNPNRIIDELQEGNIVIVAGFQGVTQDGDITTLGRGGSDTTATLLGEALKCNLVEIYTDVDGVMTADPRVVPDARVLESICYSEIHQLAEDGAKVIHPKAVEVAERGNIQVLIKNTLSDCLGTIISNTDKSYHNDLNRNIITAITAKKNRAQVQVELDEESKDIRDLMTDLTNKGVSIDLINFFIDKKIFTINDEDKNIVEDILILGKYKYKIISNCCKISAIGHRMRGIPGVMARIVKALSIENIEILQSSDSHTTIWVLVKEKDADHAVRALHDEFKLGKK